MLTFLVHSIPRLYSIAMRTKKILQNRKKETKLFFVYSKSNFIVVSLLFFIIIKVNGAVVAERLRRLTRNQIPSWSVGSNPTDCDRIFLGVFTFLIYF